MAIADAVRRRLLADDPDLAADEDVLRDTLDGETDALDLVRRLVRFSIAASVMEKAAAGRVQALQTRKARFAARAEAARGAAFGMLDALGLSRLDDAEFTASIRDGQPGVIVTDEDALPDEFVKVARAPDKTAIGAAIRAGRSVPGAEIANGSPSLQVRTS